MKTSLSLTPDERIQIQFNNLIRLSAGARQVNLDHSTIKSKQSGGYLSSTKGRGMEFDEARLYQPGDDIRSIDWRVTARTGKPYTKLFREERERPVFLSVDLRPSMFFATRGVFKSVQAARLASLLAWSALRQGDRIGGQIFTHQTQREIKPQNGRQAVLRLFHELIRAEKEHSQPAQTSQQTLAHTLMRLCRHVKPGSLVYLISDFRGLDASCEPHLSQLAKHCDVVLIMVSDPLESTLPKNGHYRFTDGFTDVTLNTANPQRLENYQQRFQQQQLKLHQLAKKRTIHSYFCSTHDDPIAILCRKN
ncbi:MAG: DUF58 domain-containing protein [Methylococcales bacterium]|jgi:uncharacterized protein (DUF58 family)|nr:DUF58 domain-containing protein [Methylococcales bacterium]MBT3699408.1 DUF58 domain-containing protein [Methylococcales bacterium]MBT3815333.1 DUF58 domain-containing protein [Methylococcales bacterium]MBT4663836.1 DUF58 domain-containing protein [Methylococcales bacterium]MBT4765369.1 DUF58 domain-containing protein [Methylococcales bacterium]